MSIDTNILKIEEEVNLKIKNLLFTKLSNKSNNLISGKNEILSEKYF